MDNNVKVNIANKWYAKLHDCTSMRQIGELLEDAGWSIDFSKDRQFETIMTATHPTEGVTIYVEMDVYFGSGQIHIIDSDTEDDLLEGIFSLTIMHRSVRDLSLAQSD